MRTTPVTKVTLKRKPTEGHPKTGEYTVVKMSHSDAKKVCQEKYNKNKQPMEFLKCVAALRGNAGAMSGTGAITPSVRPARLL